MTKKHVEFFFWRIIFIYLQHLLDYNDRPDLTGEDREMVIEDLVLFLFF